MSSSDYFIQLESTIHLSPIVSSYNLNIERKTEEIAFISGRIEFRDGSILDFKEFIEETGSNIVKLKYGYHYRIRSEIIFRYDNAPDPRAKKLNSYPHHKHTKGGEIMASQPMHIMAVLEEIENLMVSTS